MHNKIACIECDLLLTYSKEPGEGEKFACPRCRHILIRNAPNSLDTVLALSLTAIMTLVAAVSFPFLSLEIKGQANAISLLGVAQQLFESGFGILTIVVIACMVLLPLIYLFGLFFLALQAKSQIKIFSPITLAKTTSKIHPWTMVDVFIVGVLVALIKILGMADINFGISFWAYVIFTVLFVRIGLVVDTHCLWNWADYE